MRVEEQGWIHRAEQQGQAAAAVLSNTLLLKECGTKLVLVLMPLQDAKNDVLSLPPGVEMFNAMYDKVCRAACACHVCVRMYVEENDDMCVCRRE